MTRTDAANLFNAGLGNLRICIESRMEKAGARMVQGSVRHPGWPPHTAVFPPACLRITVARCGSPVVETVFTRQEILDSHKGVICEQTLRKIDLSVEEFLGLSSRAP